MARKVLVLGGTSEASNLVGALADRGDAGVLSYAGRVGAPRTQPLPVRIGGFGGVAGLTEYLRAERITHLVDATHPFATRISGNAVEAGAAAGVPLIALTRPPWRPQSGDRWHEVPDIGAAVAALTGAPRRVFLALGRLNLPAFATQPQHHYVLRLVDPPDGPLPLPDCTVVLARGPFEFAGDLSLMRTHGVQMVVAKNAGGVGAEAKLHAARALGLPVILVRRPALPARREVDSVDAVLRWLDHASADRGV